MKNKIYLRNRIYIPKEEQHKIRTYKIYIAGCGIGSVIAECALRMGFENITVADGDRVEASNMNRQNYLHEDIGQNKAISLKNRLLAINPNANVTAHDFFITEKNISSILNDRDVAINALDFNTKAPFIFDELCRVKKIPVLHPYNLGWAALLFVMMPDGKGLDQIVHEDHNGFEKEVVRFFLKSLNEGSEEKRWIIETLTKYEKEKEAISPPQLSVASWLLGGYCVSVLYKLATNGKVKSFPEYYFSSAW